MNRQQDFFTKSTVGYDTAHVLCCQVILFAGPDKKVWPLYWAEAIHTRKRRLSGGKQHLWSIEWRLLNIPYIEGLLYIAHSRPVSLFALLLATSGTVQPYH